ncbi:hypothetical protein GGF46_000199 [Coemansia sp. RSA 552]|nr:hypothetical protein GGF46_000199 [Coemansia sp. RSA 552]
MVAQLNLRLVGWTDAVNPTGSRVTAAAGVRDGVACGHADGRIWLYAVERSGDALELYPRSMLSIETASPVVLLQAAEIGSPQAEGSEGTVISVWEDGSVAVWSSEDGRCISQARLQGVRPTALSLQTVDYQAAATDLLMVAEAGAGVHVLAYPSLAPVHAWTAHPQWVTALAVRKRPDHLRSELITCAADGAVRIWSYDEFALAQQGGTFALDAQFAALGADQAIRALAVNPHNADEFLAVSATAVRLFASRAGELHELLRWRRQRATDAEFAGGGFLGPADVVFWDSAGTVFRVCTLHSVQGGSAGMHMTRAPELGRAASVATGLSSVVCGPQSALGDRGDRVTVLASCTCDSSDAGPRLTLTMPQPLSATDQGAANQHVFALRELWDSWLDAAAQRRNTTSATAIRDGRIALGYANGIICLVPPEQLVSGSDDGSVELHGHTAAVVEMCEALPDRLVSASKDLTLRLWNLDSAACLDTVALQSSPAVRLHRLPGADSLVLAVSRDNSTVLIRASPCERLHVTAPYPLALERVEQVAGGVELHFADGAQHTIPVPEATPDQNAEAPRQIMAAAVEYGACIVDVDVAQVQQGQGQSAHGPALALALLALLCSWGESLELDAAKQSEFGMQEPPAHGLGLALSNSHASEASLLFPGNQRSASWCVSPLLNAQRMLAMLALARSALQGNEKRAVEIINFYVGRLPALVGPRYKPLALLALVRFWQSDNEDLQRAARTLVLSAVHRASEKRRRAEVFHWSSVLARGAPDADVGALTIVCVMAADFSALLPLTARSMAAAQLQAQLARGGAGAAAAMELVARGFAAFRPYLDCQLVIRQLLAALGGEPGRTDRGSGEAARAALVRIAAADMGLVSAALGGILRTGTIDERLRALQAVGVVARRSAAQAKPHAPALAEAVVTAVDPHSATARRSLAGAAGAALQALDRAFPAVAFSPEAQLVAVGLADGRSVAFDLRAGARAAEVAGAGAPVAAVAISPQGDRVASFSMDGRLSVWDPAPSALAQLAKSLLWTDQRRTQVAPAKTLAIPDGFLSQSGMHIIATVPMRCLPVPAS